MSEILDFAEARLSEWEAGEDVIRRDVASDLRGILASNEEQRVAFEEGRLLFDREQFLDHFDQTIRTVAFTFCQHPDYRPEWQPYF